MYEKELAVQMQALSGCSSTSEVAGNEHYWCALQVRPNHEWTAADHLAAKRCDYFLPVYQSARQWSDRVRKITLPLFPGYLFCRYHEQIRSEILSTFGVVRILGHGKRAACVSDDEIAAIRAMSRSGLDCRPAAYLVTGARVCIQSGPLKIGRAHV